MNLRCWAGQDCGRTDLSAEGRKGRGGELRAWAGFGRKGGKKRKQILALGQPRPAAGEKGKSTGLVGALL